MCRKRVKDFTLSPKNVFLKKYQGGNVLTDCIQYSREDVFSKVASQWCQMLEMSQKMSSEIYIW